MARGFNGTTDRIDYTVVDGTASQAQTFSAWVYSDDAPGYEEIIAQHKADNLGYAVMMRFQATSAIYFVVAGGTFLVRLSANGVVPNATWFHLLYTWNGSNTAANVHIYVNNVEIGYVTTTNGANLLAPAGLWSLGGYSWIDSACFDGGLANIGWWNRVLSAGERAILADGFSPRFIPNGLKFAPDLIRNQRDLISGQAGTLDGTEVRAHPRIIQPCGVL